jgi:hypothetical protein
MSKAESDIRLQEKDKDYTEQIRNVTLQIADLLENEENTLTGFLNEFTEILNHIITQPGYMDVNVRNSIRQECMRLAADAEDNLKLLERIIAWTDSKKRAELSKLSIKVEIQQDVDQEKRLVRVLHNNDDLISLVDDIHELLRTTEREVNQDISASDQTARQAKAFHDRITGVRASLLQIIEQLDGCTDIEIIRKDMQVVIDEIRRELSLFQSLDRLERMHLQLLIHLCGEEEKSIEKEKRLSQGNTQSLDYLQEG